MKIVVGISGGVDSAVAAALLLKKGYSVAGAFLLTGTNNETLHDAEQVANQLGIKFDTIDISRDMDRHVCSPFIESYLNAKTPNPCVTCNQRVKFPSLIRYADEIGAEKIATGHYARVSNINGHNMLLKAKSGNDQSYMMYRLHESILDRLVLPLGELMSKDEVRKIAEDIGLRSASKPDSMEICFIEDDNHGRYIENKVSDINREGDILNENGDIIGKHKGIHRYTLGQRRKLGISSEERIYVIDICPEKNTVVLGKKDALNTENLVLEDLILTEAIKIGINYEATAKLRHSKNGCKVKFSVSDDGCAKVTFFTPQKRPAAGQSVVLYDDDIVIGGGIVRQ